MTYPDNRLPYDTPLYIRELQVYLQALSAVYPTIPRVEIDGLYDTETTDAVRAAQTLFSLPPTGEIDHATWNAIDAAYRAIATREPLPIAPFVTPYRVLKAGDSGDTVAIVQLMLRALARPFTNVPAPTPNGVMDAATVEAVGRLQAAAGLPITGEVDSTTWNTLVQAYSARGLW